MEKVKKENSQCSGCGCCEKCCPVNAISMEYEDGFLYPFIDKDKCINCGKCLKVCPFTKKFFDETSKKPLKVIGLINKDVDVLKTSTSGGAFSLFSNYILSKKGIIYGVSYNDKWEVVHVSADTKEKRDLLKGSKYVQSTLNNTFVDIKRELEDGRLVMFAGTPCQCSGLKNYLGKDYSNLIICDIVCHGVPSPVIFSEYIKYIQKKRKSKITSYNFRDKNISWAGANITVKYENGKCFTNSIDEEIFSKLYFNHIITRPSCHVCNYTNVKRIADLTIGDFWGIKEKHPDFYNKNGVSLVLLNSDKAIKMFTEIKEECNYIESNTEECLQPQLIKPIEKATCQDDFWREYNKYGIEYVMKKYTSIGLKNRIKAYIKKPLKIIYKKIKK